MAERYRKVVKVSERVHGICVECNKALSFATEQQEWINHYLDHGYSLLHVGQETSRDEEGRLWQHTVAVLGKQ